MLLNKKTRGPCALALCLTTNLAMGQSSKVVTYTLFLCQDVEIEHIFALWAAVSEIIADFQNCHVWAWNLHAWPLAKIQEVAHILSFPQGLKIELILTPRTADSDIQCTGQISKLSYFGTNSRSCTYTLFLAQGVEIELIFALRAAVSEMRTNFQNCHIWAWNLSG